MQLSSQNANKRVKMYNGTQLKLKHIEIIVQNYFDFASSKNKCVGLRGPIVYLGVRVIA